MTKIEIYTTTHCPYCMRAKALLDRRGFCYTEICVDQDSKKRNEMLERSDGKRTVPQIFINGQRIGGFSELWKLEQNKKLDELLKQ